MKQFLRTVKQTVVTLILTIAISSGVFQNFTFPSSWGNGICQTLDEDDPPSQKPIQPEA